MTPMEAILASVVLVVTNLLSTASAVMTFITAQPIILIPIVASIAFMGFGVIKKFVRQV